jgi:hypothetical protein
MAGADLVRAGSGWLRVVICFSYAAEAHLDQLMPLWVSRGAVRGYIRLTKGVATMASDFGLEPHYVVIAADYAALLADNT